MEQLHAQRLLETAHELPYGGRRHTQLVPGHDVAAVPGRGLEGTQRVQVVWRSHDGRAYRCSGVVAMPPGACHEEDGARFSPPACRYSAADNRDPA
jgi:hypothetical protein